jgi:hypothetical protein
MKKRQPVDAQGRLLLFSAKYTVLPTGCWEWTAAKIPNGYGIFWDGSRPMLAHRWAYEQFVGPIPICLELDHLCRKRDCVNPIHLEPVTHRENGRRGVAGAHRVESARAITHCPSGHVYDQANTGPGHNPNGRSYRVCRACKREQRRSYYAANATAINLKKRLARSN